MKSKEAKKTVEQLAAEIVAERQVRIIPTEVKGYGRYDGVGLEWTGIIKKPCVIERIFEIGVGLMRSDDKEISYFIKIEEPKDSHEILHFTKTAEEAFAVKDLLDDMIAAFREGNADGQA